LVSDSNFTDLILDEEKPALVYFTTKEDKPDDNEELKRVFQELKGAVNLALFKLPEDELSELKQNYKLPNKFPSLRFYKNAMTGDEKKDKSFEIYIKGKKYDDIMEEIDEGLVNEVREISEAILSNMAQTYAVDEQKHILLYFYKEGRISPHIKALSTHPFLKEEVVFFSIFEPSQNLVEGLQLRQLPALGGVLKAEN